MVMALAPSEEKEEKEPAVPPLGQLEKTAESIRCKAESARDRRDRGLPPDDIEWILAPLAVTIIRMNLAAKHKTHKKEENHAAFAAQLIVPFFFAGCGLLGTGILLDHASETEFFTKIPQAFVLVPVLLGLKGNLEMTFAARLSTLANCSLMDTRSQILGAFLSNMALIQVQAVVVSSVAVGVSLFVQIIHAEGIDWGDLLCLLTTAVATASILSFVLGSFILLIILVAKRLHMNPDNMTTPIAAALGDLSTLACMMFLGGWLYSHASPRPFVLFLLLSFFLLLALVATAVAAKNDLTRDVLIHGWWAVMGAMVIGCASGEVLRKALRIFPGISVFQPLINGIGGNMSAVQASRISTVLHQKSKEKDDDTDDIASFCSPCRAFCSTDSDSTAARILLLLAVAGHSFFFSAIFLLPSPPYAFSFPLAGAYLAVAITQVSLLLFVCQWLVRAMWRWRIDPDSSAIPLLTASGDLVGTALLSLSFAIVSSSFPALRLGVESA